MEIFLSFLLELKENSPLRGDIRLGGARYKGFHFILISQVFHEIAIFVTFCFQVQVIPVIEEKPPEEEKPPKEFKVMVEVVQHEFGPLPPSPVEEDDEYADVLRPSPAQTPRGKPQGNENREPFYR